MSSGPFGIFISYRRGDSADVTGRIYDHLSMAFGEEVVFKDVDAIPLGVDFRHHLSGAISRCRVVLVIIGRSWADARDESGRRRLDDPADFVRVEVASALERQIPVIPLLVGGATMPIADELPPDLRDLSFRNGTTIKPDPDFRADMQRLIRGLQAHFEATNRQTEAPSIVALPELEPAPELLHGRTGSDGGAGPAERSYPRPLVEAEPAPDMSREVTIETFGTWSYRPVDEPGAEWIGITTPATVVVYPGEEVYQIRVGRDARGMASSEHLPSDEQLALLKNLRGLDAFQGLVISGNTTVTDVGLGHIGELTSLIDLSLARSDAVSDAGLAQLGSLSRLRKLSLAYCDQITDAGLVHLRRLPSLERLDLSGCRSISDAGLGNLRGLASLRELKLSGCELVTDAGLAHLMRLKRLETLWLDWCDLSDSGLSKLSELPALRALGLGFCSAMTADGLRRVTRIPGLRHLDIRGSGWLDDDAMGYLSWLTELEHLGLAWCDRFTEAGLTNLYPLTSLQQLDLRGCTQLSDGAMEHLAKLASLRRLSLIDCPGLSDEALTELIVALTSCGIDR
jgi:hypothetical protein